MLAQDGSVEGDATTLVPAETTTPRCPYCQSDNDIKPLGRVLAIDGVIKSTYCCSACDRAFYLVRTPLS
jgi:transposase-like protein